MATGSNYEKGKRRARRVISFLSWVFVIVSLVVLYLGWGSEDNFKKDMCYEIITGVLFAAITVLAMNLANWIIFKEDLDAAHDREVAERIWNLLKAERSEDSIITQLYNEDAAKNVMRNSISFFNRRLSEDFCKLIKTCSKIVRENFSYVVDVRKTHDDSCYLLRQELRYTRHFMQKERVFMKCGFALTANALDRVLEDASFFFREIITDNNLIKDIKECKAAGKNDEIISMLNFSMHLHNGNDCEEQKDIKVEIIDELIVFEITVPDRFVMSSNNGLVCYEGEMHCEYNAPLKNNFYCVFADTIIGKTRFTIKFDDEIVDNIKKDVDIITFLTFAPDTHKESNIQRNPVIYKRNQLSYETKETIFPRSGLVVNWNKR